MENSLGTGFMAVFAVSGSVVFIAMQLHKRLLSDFMKKIEFEIGTAAEYGKDQVRKKKVRFSDEVVELSWNDEERSKKHLSKPAQNEDENLEAMPRNWQVLYKGILKNRNVKGCN
ncbi:uncharacterized protein LOC111378777 [Olea europaea var. sylvestris]|uniref:Uncharacterized protein LOC111378777 n=1 Tax=Olea europaea subsp. europaea TaxID=158383 RepID=A0A8S0U2Y3_OLEEU|nr:uncharacterized protein LOC111378777 [Olea europaea var. sylvestris]CAA3012684.1 uncharacterized protein LOC111378777 [Olea europaea subsp. europaea]